MDNDHFEGACAASDLAARLAADVAHAITELEAAEQRFRDAAHRVAGGLIVVPFGIRRAVTACRRRVKALQQLLDGIVGPGGGCHAASA
jgi:hypothetical protein